MSEITKTECNAVRNPLQHPSIFGVFGTGHLSAVECWNPSCKGWSEARTTLNTGTMVLKHTCTLCNKVITEVQY